MPRPTPREIANEIATATRELYREGKIDKWGAKLGLDMAKSALSRGHPKPRQNVAPKVEAAE